MSIMFLRSIRIAEYIRTLLLSCRNSIPLYGKTTSCSSIHPLRGLFSSFGKNCAAMNVYGLYWWLSSKIIRLQCRRHCRCGFDPWFRKISWRRAWQSTPAFLPGESYGQRSLVVCSPRGCRELDMTEATEQAHMNVCEKVFVRIPVFNSLRHIPSREIAGS